MAPDRNPQNIYDDPRFFAGYAQMERFGPGWDRAVEHSSFLALVPDVQDLRVLDLGCGAGQLAQYLAVTGAAEVHGVDVSARMIELARTDRAHPRVTYSLGPIEALNFPADRFDVVVSSLALHYVEDYEAVVRRVARWLVSGGVFVYSTEHPIYTARLPGNGWVVDAQSRRTKWAIDNYAEEGLRVEHWFVDGVRKYHRTMSTLLNGLIEAGFSIERVVEPIPSEDWLQRHPDGHDERRRPMFLLFRAVRPRNASSL
jgi:2-polyprenyl-3-methyl-5-hydroxy-6-metoxy-1,4-benzoquinol methylase